jgi:hypothetical protein
LLRTKRRVQLILKSGLVVVLVATVSGCSTTFPLARIAAADPAGLVRAVAETFDPETLQEELLLIQPRFQPPSADAIAAAPPPDTLDVSQDPVFRVQIMALSNRASAHSSAQQLQRKLKVPVVVDRHKELFLVRAGAYLEEMEAEVLRARIVALDNAFQSAYVVQVGGLGKPDADEEPVASVDHAPATEAAPPVAAEMVREFGWRVSLNQFLVHEKARAFKLRAQRDLRRADIDVTFKEPYYKVEVGNFRDEAEAQLLAERIRNRGFPYSNALKVRGEILVPANPAP